MKKPKILYVDDEPLNLMLLKANLSKQYEVLTAPDGMTALEVLRQNDDIGLVFSDMKMPRMSGIEFIRRAMQLKSNRRFYIVTGYDAGGEIQEAVDKGLISKYFNKPFDMDEIGAEIAAALKSSNN